MSKGCSVEVVPVDKLYRGRHAELDQCRKLSRRLSHFTTVVIMNEFRA
jgi:hypothetical protein